MRLIKTEHSVIIASIILLISIISNFYLKSQANSPNLSEPAIPKVTARLIASVKAVSIKQSFKLGVELIMPPGWHTYYKESGAAGMPTKINWHLPTGFVAGALEWQEPDKFTDSGITTYGYHGRTLIATTITPGNFLPSRNKLTFSATVKWLQCKDLCVPGQQDVFLTLPVIKGKPKPANTHLFVNVGYKGSKVNQVPPQNINILTDKLQIQGANKQPIELSTYLILAFVGGFILNFMPCVLPVIAIKILGLVEQAGVDAKRVFQLGLTFTAGILASFLALAVLVLLLQKSGQQVGWGFQFQHPAFVIAMSVIVLLFALSLFGLFYVPTLPGQNSVNALAEKEGYLGTFFKGVLATTLSTPCTAPFLGTAVGFAFTEPAWVIIMIFFCVGLGMAAPYLALTAKPGWLRFMPKPGAWMEKFKQSLGFLLLITVIWLLHVLGSQIGFEQALWVAAFLIILTFAVWCISTFINLASSQHRKYTVWALALTITGVGYYFCIATIPGLGVKQNITQKPYQITSAYEEPAADGIKWLPFSVDVLNSNLSSGKTVFLDFTAKWCLTCQVNEKTVINTQSVINKMKALKIVAMKADWTKQDAQISDLLHKFGRSGVPLYVIFPANHPTEPIVLPEVITTSIVLTALDKAGPSKP